MAERQAGRPITSAPPAGPPRESGRDVEPIAELRAALGFLTRLPVDLGASGGARTGAAAFALVGSFAGSLAAVPLLVLGTALPLPAAVLALVTLAVVSGALHLDGLADTADALAAPTPEAAERARTDPRAGAAGVVAVVLALALDASLLAAMASVGTGLAAAGLVVATTASRAAPPIAVRLAGPPAGSGSQSLGGWFAAGSGRIAALVALTTTALVTTGAAVLIGSGRLALGALAGAGAGAVVSGLLVVRRGRLDGDGHGAIIEVMFASILGGVAIATVAP